MCCSLPHRRVSQRTSSLWRGSKILVTFLLSFSTSCSNTSLFSSSVCLRCLLLFLLAQQIHFSPPPTHTHLPSFWPLSPLLFLLSCSLSPLPVQEGQSLFLPNLSYTTTTSLHRSPNPSVPLMGAISDSSATFPSSSVRTSLHP